jgi:hypothetical protein
MRDIPLTQERPMGMMQQTDRPRVAARLSSMAAKYRPSQPQPDSLPESPKDTMESVSETMVDLRNDSTMPLGGEVKVPLLRAASFGVFLPLVPNGCRTLVTSSVGPVFWFWYPRSI